MSRTQVDYDRLAPTYDRRFAAGGHEGIAAALQGLAQELDAGRILEVGCGTGYWLAGLAATAVRAHGLDFSPGMLSRAQERRSQEHCSHERRSQEHCSHERRSQEHCSRERRGALHLVRGQAGSLPYAGGAFDLVYCVNAIHHFRDQAGFVRHAYRLLRPGGVLAVFGNDPHQRRDLWYVYDYFEGTWQTDLARFPSWGTILDWMIGAGFRRTAWRPVDRIYDPKHGRAVLDDPFLAKNSCSQLALLSDAAYAAGLRRIEADLDRAEAAGRSLIFQSDLTLAMLTAYKGPRAGDDPPPGVE